MPFLGSGYTFADFIARLERSPVTHMSPLYHAHRELFAHRPDMLTRAISSLPWEKGCALVNAAYHSQPIPVLAYRAVLARMLLHNRHVHRVGAGSLVPWRAAWRVYGEALLAHGNALPTRMTRSAIRLLAPHRRWEEAVALLQLCEANARMTRPMLLDAARCCATPAAWHTGVELLRRLNAERPDWLSAPRVEMEKETTALLPTDALTATQPYARAVLTEVAAAAPAAALPPFLHPFRPVPVGAGGGDGARTGLLPNSPSAVSSVLRQCALSADGWRTAAPFLLSVGPVAPPGECTGAILLQLRAAGEAETVVAVLLRCLVPGGAVLPRAALEVALACVLAHNRAGRHLPVHWRAALGWATSLQSGPNSHRPITPKMLSLLIHISVHAGCPRGALAAMGYARAADKTELAMAAEIRAILFCLIYDRPYEAEAIVKQAAKKHGAENAKRLERLLSIAQEGRKQRELVTQREKEGKGLTHALQKS